MKRNYVDQIAAAGAVPLVLPFSIDAVAMITNDLLDGVLFAGGEDISSALSGAKRSQDNYQYCVERDKFELSMARACIDRDIPVLGICRGCQILYVATGGRIIFDIEEEIGTDVRHRISIRQPSKHTVNIEPDSRLERVIGSPAIDIISYHHQGLRWDLCQARSWRVAARSPDGLIEAIEHQTSTYALGVLWHPEMTAEESCFRPDLIIADFVSVLGERDV
ncbi:gamma-glutamyl-gamma-aminobutyrate hydrolase family protein [Acetobacter sicerae]|uniref:Gamma-glutamyl-gamma-aminobutyrate hydrolase family protein n=1 Tax=Acetobacter sicerae TaxID=85325 RepID=A0ABS8VSH5_9PROT|nr:gamma-glutamyl-gamma-aminobutyrate hydrolase family protein [Acetobacter sicerae]